MAWAIGPDFNRNGSDFPIADWKLSADETRS
jgi:hypothetical protein